MKQIAIQNLSGAFELRKLNENDVELIYEFCQRHTLFYEHCGKANSRELIRQDLAITPPGIPMEQKNYLGFFAGEDLVAVMDLIDGYPEPDHCFIGFFMMDAWQQGKGIGSRILTDALGYLSQLGFRKCQLGIDKTNPQSNHFWRKNGFRVIREVVREDGTILLAEKQL